jgi:GDPmannose 4,6-dehydratase
MPSAFVSGASGQDGSYLCDLLLAKGYRVHGLIRRSSSINTSRLDHIFEHKRLRLHYGDVCDGSGLARLLAEIKPDEIYHLAAQSHVRVSFDVPEYTGDTVALGTVRLLEAMRRECPKARFYQASSSEMFGSAPPPQSETTIFQPRSPYACAKVYAYHTAINYREAYGLHISNGILFNHESPRRGETFVSRKISRAVARIKAGLQDRLSLGNLDAKRDWGYAPEFVEAMWLMLQQENPGDYVIATGESRTVREMVEHAFDRVGLDWEKHVDIDPRLLRPTEVNYLRGNPNKAKRTFGWSSTVKFAKLVDLMVEAEVKEAHREEIGAVEHVAAGGM